MKLKYQFVTNPVADKTVAVAVGPDLEKFKGIIKMNDTGAFIFKLLKKDMTIDQIVEALEKEYDAPREVLKESAEEFVEQLRAENVLE